LIGQYSNNNNYHPNNLEEANVAKGKKDKKGKKKRKGYKLGAKIERAEKDPRDGYGYNRAYYGNQRRPKEL